MTYAARVSDPVTHKNLAYFVCYRIDQAVQWLLDERSRRCTGGLKYSIDLIV